MTTLDAMLDAIFAGRDRTLYDEFAGWARASRRFRAFAAANQTKIRAKLKNAGDESAMADLRAELAAAATLLRDDRFTLEYEAYAAAKQRGPDYTVTFRSHTSFNVEVRRVRGNEGDNSEARATKLVAVLLDKARQMPPGTVNLLWLAAEPELVEDNLSLAMMTLRQLAERKVEEAFTRHGYKGAADFLKHYGRLSGIVWRQAGALAVSPNPLARHKTPPAIAAAIRRLGPPADE